MAKRRKSAAHQIPSQTVFTGDNLEILRGVNSESVDLFYLDPPFNSNRDYAAPIGGEAAGAHFTDRWTMDDVKTEWIGLIDEENERLADILRMAGHVAGKRKQAYLTYMAVRMLEMHRVLKPAGTLLLHCDDTMSAWLELVLDAMFEGGDQVSRITWKRRTSKASGARMARVCDTILAYEKVKGSGTQNRVHIELDERHVAKAYRHEDKHGRFQKSDLTAAGNSSGDSGKPWRGVDPGSRNKHWVAKTNIPDWAYEQLPSDYEELPTRKKLDALDEVGLIDWSATGVPRYKFYLEQSGGEAVTNLITHVPPIQATSQERTGYPTQKPKALLAILIQAFSNPGDLVLDPFCGCATTCISAEDTGRDWIGIDISAKAVELVKSRFAKELPLLTMRLDHHEVPPVRTDGAQTRSPDIRHTLYGQQEGNCEGCGHHFHLRNLTLDHKLPTSRGGADADHNLQLLCHACNSTKGDRDMAYLRARPKETGVLDG